MPGIGNVINELHVQRQEEPWLTSPRPVLTPTAVPATEPVAPEPGLLASMLMGVPAGGPLAVGRQLAWRPADFFPPREPTGMPADDGAASQTFARPSGETITSMPAIHIAAHPPLAAPEPPAVLLPPRPASDLLPAIHWLLQADARFRRLQPEVRGGTVHLRGVVYSWTDLHTCAEAISKIPGVQRVELEDVQTEGMARN